MIVGTESTIRIAGETLANSKKIANVKLIILFIFKLYRKYKIPFFKSPKLLYESSQKFYE